MSSIVIPPEQWGEFLEAFSRRHSGWLVAIDASDFRRLESIALDLEDEKNPRINVMVRMDNKQFKHILFRPSRVVLHISRNGTEEAIQIESVNASTTVRLRVSIEPELVDGVA
jgi:hypothetical protein